MILVDKPTLAPAMCLLLKKDNLPCFDLLNDFDFDHAGRMYLSVAAVEDMARMIGMDRVGPDAARIAELEATVAGLEADLVEERRHTAAIDVLESKGFTARRKPGRKPAAKEATSV